jgi:guanosine-3',5'-bis(diphosphate) 3'-pyrophosphohydrolase
MAAWMVSWRSPAPCCEPGSAEPMTLVVAPRATYKERMSDLDLVIRAAAFAADKHRDQRRKDVAATPYINHPLELARILSIEGGVTDAVTIAAALLHDTIEDTETTAAELEEQFGSEIRSIVEEVTDDKTLSKPDRKRMQVEHAAHASHKAKLVKLADKIANLRDVAASPPHRWDLARCQEYFDSRLAKPRVNTSGSRCAPVA